MSAANSPAKSSRSPSDIESLEDFENQVSKQFFCMRPTPTFFDLILYLNYADSTFSIQGHVAETC